MPKIGSGPTVVITFRNMELLAAKTQKHARYHTIFYFSTKSRKFISTFSQMQHIKYSLAFSGLINSACSSEISGTKVASCPLCNDHKCSKEGQKASTKVDIFKIICRSGKCALESKVLWEIKGGPPHQSTLNFNYLKCSADSASCKHKTSSA